MMSVSEIFVNSELALAAYADLQKNITLSQQIAALEQDGDGLSKDFQSRHILDVSK